jgi:hypothetical protein
VTFKTLGQLFPFRLENRSEDDTYMNAFIFHVDSEVYSTSDFDFQISPESLKPLKQQSTNTQSQIPDMFVLYGVMPQSPSDHFFLLYVYRLAPHESRDITIRLVQHVISTIRDVDVSSEIMSPYRNAVPVNKHDDVVFVPLLVKKPLLVSGFLTCLIDKNSALPCSAHPAIEGQITIPKGCWYIAVRANAALPSQIEPIANCEP